MVAHLFSVQERKGDVGVDVEIILFPLWGVVRPICVRKEDIYENSLIFGAITKSIDAASLIESRDFSSISLSLFPVNCDF